MRATVSPSRSRGLSSLMWGGAFGVATMASTWLPLGRLARGLSFRRGKEEPGLFLDKIFAGFTKGKREDVSPPVYGLDVSAVNSVSKAGCVPVAPREICCWELDKPWQRAVSRLIVRPKRCVRKACLRAVISIHSVLVIGECPLAACGWTVEGLLSA